MAQDSSTFACRIRGTSARQGIHDPTRPSYNPVKPPLDAGHLPPGVTPVQALRDTWEHPVELEPRDFDVRRRFIGEAGYSVNDQGWTNLDMRVSKNGVHGWPIP